MWECLASRFCGEDLIHHHPFGRTRGYPCTYAEAMSATLTKDNAADISLSGVSRIYELGDEKIHALRNLTLEIRQGEFVAI